MSSNGDEQPPSASIPSASAATTTPFLSSTLDDADEDDIEALAAKACALASIPVKDYAEAMARDKKKSGDRFTIADDDEDDDAEDPEVTSQALAEKTSQILSSFQDYVSGIGGEAGDATKDILDAKKDDKDVESSMADAVRSDNKDGLLAAEQQHHNTASSYEPPLMQRDWAYEGYNQSSGNGNNLHRGHGSVHHSGTGSIGSWEDESEVRRMMTMQRGQKYTHPWIQSRKIKIGIASSILGAALIFGVGYGISSIQNNNSKSQANEELGDELDNGATGMEPENTNMGPPAGGGGNPDNDGKRREPTPQEILMITMARYAPKEYDRSQGWLGKTYLEAYDFCSSRPSIEDGVPYDICPYEAICPLGPDTMPTGGYAEDASTYNWVPIADNANDWVQLGRQNACIQWSSENEVSPDWGVTGSEDDEITSRVMCCLLIDTIAGAFGKDKDKPHHEYAQGQQQYVFQNVMNKYRPGEFNRERGWTGTTYLEAVSFCDEQRGPDGEEYAICPYDAICPMGQDTKPLGGYKDDVPGMTWMPIADSYNDWTQLSQENTCIKWSVRNADEPEWGINGDEDEKMTSHIMCCMAEHHVDEDAAINHDFLNFPPGSAGGNGDPFDVYKSIEKVYFPLEYDRSNGWGGQTYIAARQFCGATEGYDICPYEAICPLGSGSIPLFGRKESAKGTWLPILDALDDWVQIGFEKPCTKFSQEEHPEMPDWSVSGIDNEEITRDLLCCRLPDVYIYEDDFDSVPIGGDSTSMTSDASTGGEGSSIANQQPVDTSSSTVNPGIFAYEFVTQKYLPMYFNRDEGWGGHTYGQADYFCSEIEGHGLCSFATICPLGPDSEPMGGYRNMPDGSGQQTWMPISNTMNDWVQVSEGDSCIRYSGEYPDPPRWGITGVGSEEFTQNIMCCLLVPNDIPIEPSEPSEDMQIEYNEEMDIENHEVLESEFIEEQKEENEGMESEYDAMLAYKEAATKYEPMSYNRNNGWMGQTYLEAVEFCGTKGDRSLCPYKVICPMGAGTNPLGRYREGEESWISVLDEAGGANDWVQVSEENACILWSSEHASTPDWGLTGDGNEEITRDIMCCIYVEEEVDSFDSISVVSTEAKTDESATEPTIDPYIEGVEQTYESEVSKFLPIMFNREDGWNGKTYLEAVQFCGNRDGYEICPYEAICPMGPDAEPIGGYVESSSSLSVSSAWAPISDDGNDWVNLSSENGCIRWTHTYSTTPDWGLTGEDSEDMTQNVLCCEGTIWGGAEESFMYEMAAKKYHPLTFQRESGWTGQTYEAAVEFCGSSTLPNHAKTGLCPYEALCPVSNLDKPLGGLHDEPNGSWAPFSGPNNSWVSVSPENTCEVYDVVYGKPPDWGETGVGNEDLTRHITCCDIGEAGDEEFTLMPASGKPTPMPTPLLTPLPTPLPSKSPTPLPTMLPTTLPTPLPTPLPTLLPTPLQTPLPTPQPTPMPSMKPTLPPIAGAMGIAIEASKNAERYNPQWYDRTTGWLGQTYDEAFQFCSSKGPQHDICPYEVICPSGPLSLPYGGSRSERTSWAPINQPFNSWVLVTDPQVCVQYQNLNPKDHPQWGLTGVDDEDLTRHIMCCEMPDDDALSNSGQSDGVIQDAVRDVMEKYAPKWFDRSEGWSGKSYADAISFCAAQDSYIPCPYEAYCPLGQGTLPTGGYDGDEEAWAAIMDSPNGWVQIGSYQKSSISNSCMKYNDLHDTPPLWGLMGNADNDITPHLMCCKEPPNHFIEGMDTSPESAIVAVATTEYEQQVLEENHPVWFGRKHGYHGTTHSEAVDFCKAVSDMVLCPLTAYCPSEPDSDLPLFLKREPFEGEQWAPVASESGMGEEHWISIGGSNTCSTHDELFLPQPSWASDGSSTELKEHVLCCQNPKYLAKELSLHNDLSPIWMDTAHGWNGGSHDDASQFCAGFGNRKPCPYTAYCPHGPGQPVIGGHASDFNTEGEQWAPVYGEQNHWVMIGQKYQNRATTCMGSQELEGGMPDWGMTSENADMKKHVMCCAF